MSTTHASLVGRVALALELIRWHRPEGWLLLWPTMAGLWLAAGGFPGWGLLIIFGCGTLLMRSAGCCFNDSADYRFDANVLRTRERPVARRAVSPSQAVTLGGALVGVAFCLVLRTNLSTILWSVGAVLIAVVYPFAKRFFLMPQLILGLAFSLGIPMAFSAVHGSAWLGLGPRPALVVGLIVANLFWVLAYDTVYAMVDRADDLIIGIKSSAISLGRWDVVFVSFAYFFSWLCWASALLSWRLHPMIIFGLASAGALTAWHIRELNSGDRERLFHSFASNHWIGFLYFLGIVLSV